MIWIFGAPILWWEVLHSLGTGGWFWSCLSLMCWALLTPHGKPYPFLRSGWGVGEQEVEKTILGM